MRIIAERPTYGGPDLHVQREGEMGGSPGDYWLRIGRGRKWRVSGKSYRSVEAGGTALVVCSIHTTYDVRLAEEVPV